MELNRKAEIITERLILKRRVKYLERQLKKYKTDSISREERRKKFNITSISKVKVGGHWYFKGTEILACQ
tara:strand:- start:1613 stop:1822 length:210 start_codon:yes stop_codon:yes gene_type:complete